jgi:hypothetical protein
LVVKSAGEEDGVVAEGGFVLGEAGGDVEEAIREKKGEESESGEGEDDF